MVSEKDDISWILNNLTNLPKQENARHKSKHKHLWGNILRGYCSLKRVSISFPINKMFIKATLILEEYSELQSQARGANSIWIVSKSDWWPGTEQEKKSEMKTSSDV